MSTVLIVDDDQKIRKLLRILLTKEGIDVIEAENGEAGVTLFREKSPEAVVIDIIMPEKDGLTAIREIKALNREARIIAMSGGLVLTPAAYLEEARRNGADHILSKPIDGEQFFTAIRELLAR
jgi:DNA-binding response OmpR family regulator